MRGEHSRPRGETWQDPEAGTHLPCLGNNKEASVHRAEERGWGWGKEECRAQGGRAVVKASVTHYMAFILSECLRPLEGFDQGTGMM